MISDTLTNLNSNSSVTDVIVAFNQTFGGWAIFSLMIALLIVIALAIYSWNNDMISGFMNGAFIMAVLGFFLSISKNSVGVPVLTGGQEMFFIVLTALLTSAKKMKG